MNEAMHAEVRIGDYGRLQVNFFQDMLRELGSEINTETLILDFGCGEGGIVYHLRKQGFKAFGVDIVKDYENVQKRCEEEGLVEADEDAFRLIDMSNYKIPFDDNTFDVIISDQVFEHVQNYPEALAEIKRVLKPGGSSLHIIPSRYRLIEGHLFIPLGGIFQGHRYLALCALLGIRNVFIKCHFGRVRRYLYPISRKIPFVSSVFCTLHSRVVFSKKEDIGSAINAAKLPTEARSKRGR